MTHWLDEALVGASLLASALYAAVSLGPRGVRRRLLSLAGTGLGRMPRWFGLRALAERCTAAAVQAPGACGGCNSCAGEEPAQGRAGGPAQDVRISPAQIGRRRNPAD